MQQFWIQVFNQKKLNSLMGGSLISSLREAHFESLCSQYGLDPEGILDTLEHLELIAAPEEVAPFFLLKYGLRNKAPLVIYHWVTDKNPGSRWLAEAEHTVESPLLRSRLVRTREIWAISLTSSQLQGMGLVLAYEVARWAAAEGAGLVLGLDQTWYRLNQHQAFLPIDETE